MTAVPAWARWLDPQMRAFIALTGSFYGEEAPDEGASGDVTAARAAYDRMCAAFRKPRPPGVATEDGGLPSGARVRRYRPDGEREGAARLLYLHGGGFILGGLDSHDDVCAELAAGAGVAVTAVDYRLAPEHRYPAALDDAQAAYDTVAADGPVVVAGDSAGGNLAAALCHRLRRLGRPQPRAQVLIYPGLSRDPLRVTGSRAATAPMLSAEDCAYYGRMYLGADEPPGAPDPELAPLDAVDLAGLAPAAIFAAGYDPLRQDAEDYAALLHAAGVAVTYRDDPGLVHGWLRARHSVDLARVAFAAVVAEVRRLTA